MKRIASDNAIIQPIVFYNSIKRSSVFAAYFIQVWILHVKHESAKTEVLRLRCETVRVLWFHRTFWQIKRI